MLYYLFAEVTFDRKPTEDYKPIYLVDKQEMMQLEKITKDDIAVIECGTYLCSQNSIRLVNFLRNRGVRIITSFANSLFLYIQKKLLTLPPSFLKFIFNEAISYDTNECKTFSIPYCIFPMDSNNTRKIIFDTNLPETKVYICQTYANTLYSKDYSKIIETSNLITFLKKEGVDFKNVNALNEASSTTKYAKLANLPENVISSCENIEKNMSGVYQKNIPVNFEIWSFPVNNYISDSIPLAIKHNKRIITTCPLIKETPFYNPNFILIKDSFANLNENDLKWINNKFEVKYQDGVDEYFSGDSIAKKILGEIKKGTKFTNNIFSLLVSMYNLQGS